ncbi:response regulator transcription factor [Sphingobium cloacae]|uniref:Winged helix family two componenttranscriptional regulator n=1 Tax=Sphingobium cloacae TaxID=120107 RepID=A0A1E1F6D5_9SPHN|nr:response regulator transcription factor [Sphingobium cloacae]BAV66072.1 winged helix family two componenttranscriptional regulator [Sphingobium cloacae]
MSHPLVLVAEQQRELRHDLRAFLEQSGFRALPVSSESGIWDAIATEPVDALVLDAGLRGADGSGLCGGVRARSDVPIILVGADSTEVDRIVGLELGADDFIAKPYSTREVAARLRAVLRRSKTASMPGERRRNEARFDGWIVDFARREVIDPDGAPVDLTAAEFALLSLFLDNARSIVPRDNLLKLNGRKGNPSSPRSVDVLVSRLRRKLDHPSRAAPIVTVRGLGYMFSAIVERH